MNNRTLTMICVTIGTSCYAIEAPQSPVIIKNDSSCEMTLDFEQASIAELSLPKNIAPQATEHGQITFDGSLLHSTQQHGYGQYIVSCEHKRSVLRLSFYIGDDYIDALNYFLETWYSEQSPIILTPVGKTLILHDHPVSIHILDKEPFYEQATDTDPLVDPDEQLGENPRDPEPEKQD